MYKNQRITLTRKFEFSASHRYWKKDWSEEKNNEVFGPCTSPYGHGHNYDLYVTVTGPVDRNTGMIINLTQLKSIVNDILKDFDHKFLNMDTPYFQERIPTTENIAAVLFNLIDGKLSTNTGQVKLSRIRLYEMQNLYADVWRD
jgi:6-pyruvoyltetrahydropterin/6-carboxytetrahydropterin synthase